MEITEKIREFILPIMGSYNAEIADMSYKREGGTMVLRLLLDKPGGITLDECSRINNTVGEKLDQENIIEEHYLLEVSSLGLDRPMKNRRDFERALGKELKATTYAPIDGKNVFVGKLLGLSPSAIVLEDSDGISTEIPLDKVAKARLHIDF